MTRYVPPFSSIKQRFDLATSKGKIVVSTDYDNLLATVRLLLRGVDVDESWYLGTYPDIAEAIKSGVVASAKAHFIEHGYFEGRLPFALEVDEIWYRGTYHDIAAAIDRGELPSATAHFNEFGYQEGRFSGDIG
jgi:hypothetical protein